MMMTMMMNRIFGLRTARSGANRAQIHPARALHTQTADDNLAAASPHRRTYSHPQSSASQDHRFTLPANFQFRQASTETSTIDNGVVNGDDQDQHQDDDQNQHRDRNQNLKSIPNAEPSSRRPLVLLYSWLLAKDYHLEKYRHFWNSRGYDILTIRSRPHDFLFPTIGCGKNALKVREFIAQTQPKYLLVHAFCGGNFQFLELLHQLLLLPSSSSSSSMLDRIKCLVIDSITMVEDGPEGSGKVLSDIRAVQLAIKYITLGYSRLTADRALNHFAALQVLLHKNPRKYPALLLYSRDDHIADYAKTEALADRWSRDRVHVRQKCWHTSPHVRHFRFHRAEYEREVDSFLTDLNIII